MNLQAQRPMLDSWDVTRQKLIAWRADNDDDDDAPDAWELRRILMTSAWRADLTRLIDETLTARSVRAPDLAYLSCREAAGVLWHVATQTFPAWLQQDVADSTRLLLVRAKRARPGKSSSSTPTRTLALLRELQALGLEPVRRLDPTSST